MKIFEAKKIAVEKFQSSPIQSVKATPALDADLLMSHVTGFDRSEMIIHRNTELSPAQERQFFSAVEKRETGFPVAYIIGHKEFFGLDFTVTPDVLIPKPDTEILVEKTLEIIEKSYKLQITMHKQIKDNSTFQFSPFNFHLSICDVCTGSGCVGISIIKNFPFPFSNFHFSMTDISKAALNVAQKNAKRLLNESQLANIKFMQGDLFDAVDKADSVCNVAGDLSATLQTFDIIVSNPPYIPSTIVDELLKDGRNEPRLALDGDADLQAVSEVKNDGLSIIRRLVPQAYEHLTDGGYFLCETGEYNAHEAAEIFQNTGFSAVTIFNDLAGTPRVVCGQKFCSLKLKTDISRLL